MRTTPSWPSYGVTTLNFHVEGCNDSQATLPRGNWEDKYYYTWQIHESIDGASIAQVPGKYCPLLGLLLDPKGREQEGV